VKLHYFVQLKTVAAMAVLLAAVLCQTALSGQAAQSKDAPAREKGLPARATPGDYQAHAQAGAVTIGAEFTAHSIATPQSTLATENYVVVEVGVLGAAEARTTISSKDFSLRINDKKAALPAQPYALVFESLKDPEWEPPVPVATKSSKTSIGSGGQGQGEAGSTPPPVHIPFETQRKWQQSVQKAAMPEGDRLLPAAGFLFFKYSGKASGIYSVELIYAGPAGQATLKLHP
jgi:hypothetical protein